MKNIFRQPWTLYRYIAGETLRPFIGCAVFFLFVLLMFQVIRLADVFVVHNVSGYTVILLMGYLALTFTPVIFPIAFLLAVLLGFGRLSTDSEVLAMRAAGMSVYTMVRPVVALGALLTAVTLFCNFYFVPYGARQFRYELFRIYNTKAIATIHEGTFTEGFFDMVLYAQDVDSKKSTMNKVMIYDERKKEAPITVVARHGAILNSVQDAAGTPGLVLRLMQGSLHRGTPKKQIYEKTNFDTYDIFLKIETAKVIGVDLPKTMDITSLQNKINYVKGLMAKGTPWENLSPVDRKEYLDYTVEYWKRFALSGSCLVFALMGVAFGVIRTRTVRSNSFLICLLVLLFYWGLYSLGLNMASEGKIPAPIGMWSANAILLLIALFTLRRVAR
jgi:lipopolysaccharide export system permease protein